MTAFKRWQDWTTIVAGVALLITPYVFGETSNSDALWATGVIGGAMVVLGLISASTEQISGWEWILALAGVAAFAAPWVFTFTGLTAMAWVSWVAGAAVVVAAGEGGLEAAGFSAQHA
jgi:hypothetical protein